MIYFALHREHGLIKIGESIHPWKRVMSLGPKVDLVGVIRDGPAERDLHRRFGDLRVKDPPPGILAPTEWFRPDLRLVTYIEQNCDDVDDRVEGEHRGVGRSPADPESARSVRLSSMVTEEVAQLVERRAREAGITVSTLLMHLLKREFDSSIRFPFGL